MASQTQTLRPLNTRDMIAIFGVSHMTLLHWRNPVEGVEHRKSPLPFTIKGRNVTFSAPRIKAWAEKNDVEMKKDPLVIASKPLPLKRQGEAMRKIMDREVRRVQAKKATPKKAGPKKLLSKRAPTKALNENNPLPRLRKEDRPAANSGKRNEKIVPLLKHLGIRSK